MSAPIYYRLDSPYHPGEGGVQVLERTVVAIVRGDNGGAILYLSQGGVVRVIDNDVLRRAEAGLKA